MNKIYTGGRKVENMLNHCIVIRIEDDYQVRVCVYVYDEIHIFYNSFYFVM